jgi:REP element-mobilizing transposase RayT
MDKEMVLNEVGKICEEEILLTNTRDGIDIVEWVIMPNHIHMLIHIDNTTNDKTSNVGIPQYCGIRQSKPIIQTKYTIE